MNKSLKIIIWIGGAIIAVPVGLIFLGALGAIFGMSSPTPVKQKPVPVEVTPPLTEPSVPKVKVTKPTTRTFSTSQIVLPEDIAAKDAMRWFVENQFVNSRSNIVYVDFEKFTRFSMEDALTLHQLFKKAEQAEDVKRSTSETETLKNQYYMMHLFVFAGASVFPPDERKEFAKKSGAIFPTSAFHSLTPRGDYINLFDWHKRDKSGSAEIAIRDYAKVFGDKEMIATLTKIGAIEVSQTRNNANYSSRWRISVGEKLAQLEPETLQTIHDAVKKTIGGDRVKLRHDLQQLIESRHTADNPPSND